jgi:hypothetical protein
MVVLGASCGTPTPLSIDFRPQSICSLFRAAPNVVEADVSALTLDQPITFGGQTHLATPLALAGIFARKGRPASGGALFVATRSSELTVGTHGLFFFSDANLVIMGDQGFFTPAHLDGGNGWKNALTYAAGLTQAQLEQELLDAANPDHVCPSL